jgi:hypothetical protein
MVRYERLVNNAKTTLNGGINAAVTSITVTDGSVFPAEGDYRVIVGEEIMLVTARSSNTLTVVRGIESTAAASHPDATNVTAIVTQGGMDRFARDFIDPYWLERQNRLIDINGNVLTSADFTVGNQGTSTIVDAADGSIAILMEDRADPNYVGLYRAAPSTPYTVSAHVMLNVGHNATAENVVLLGFRESSTTSLSWIEYQIYNDSVTRYAEDWNDTAGSPVASSSTDTPPRQDYWLRIEDDGTNLVYYTSADGYHWWQQHTELRGFHFSTGPDQIWFGGDSQGGDDNESIHLLAWIES